MFILARFTPVVLYSVFPKPLFAPVYVIEVIRLFMFECGFD